MTKIREHIFNIFPQNMTVKSDKNIARLKWVGDKISSPENRLIMGVTALASQPWLDYHNKDVDQRTREMSCAKTIAKIVVGTTVGVIVRASSIALAKKGCKNPALTKNLSKWSTVFTPNGIDLVKEAKYVEEHSKTMGTIIGTAAGLITNFVIDMPLTKFLTNVFINRFNEKHHKTDYKGGAQ